MVNVTDNKKDGQTIAVAMSGGVDSSVAAALLKKQGYAVFGVTAVMTRERSRCCSDEDIETARQVAKQLDIRHHVVDVSEAFEQQVIQPFVSEYLAGRTPSPCLLCNRSIKFGALMWRARTLGATRLATGHYARLEIDACGVRHLCRGKDRIKDQSYFLALLSQERLAGACFPLGQMTKQEIFRIAGESGLACRGSRESQEICFVTEGSHGSWIDVRRLESAGQGDTVDMRGKTLGRHNGIHHYTIGQRKGVGVATGRPMYVVALDADRNTVVVGDRSDVMGRAMNVRDVNWITGRPSGGVMEAFTQIRYNHKAARSSLRILNDASVDVIFDVPQFAVTPGQAAVFYNGAEVLGGGWIAAATESACGNER